MENETENFDRYLPVFQTIINQTESIVGSTKNLFEVHRHPILYGVGIYALLLIVVGTIGNGLTIFILLRSKLRETTTMRYLTAVAIADLCSLYSWNLNLFYKHLIDPYQNDLEDYSLISCRFISFVGFVSLQLSSWFLTLVSIDRCMNIHFLFWHRGFGRADRSTYIIIPTTIIILTLNLHLLFLNGYYASPCIPIGKRTCFMCYRRFGDSHYIFPKWEAVHVIVYNLIPLSIMLISTYFILRRSVHVNTIHRNMSVDSRQNSTKPSIRQRKQRQLTRTLLSVVFLFVLLTTPVMLYNVFLRNQLKDKKPQKYIFHGILLCVQFTSPAINFFIYCHRAPKFRDELKLFLSCLRIFKSDR